MTDCQHEIDAVCDIMLELGSVVENRRNGLSPFALLRDKMSAFLLGDWPECVITCDTLL